MALLVNLKPVEIEKLQRKLQKERDKQARAMKIKKALERGMQENPVKSKFQID